MVGVDLTIVYKNTFVPKDVYVEDIDTVTLNGNKLYIKDRAFRVEIQGDLFNKPARLERNDYTGLVLITDYFGEEYDWYFNDILLYEI